MTIRSPLARLFEIIPGALTWMSFLAPVVLSFRYPAAIAGFIIVYDLIFLRRSIRLTFNIVRSYRAIRQAIRTDWQAKMAQAPKLTPTGQPTVAARLQNDDLVHVVMLIFYRESFDLLDLSLASYASSTVPPSRLWLLLASEARAGEWGETVAAKIRHRYGRRFGQIILSVHPADLPGEIKCKSSNATFAGRQLATFLDGRSKAYDEILIHNFDADTRVYPNYFDAVAARYLESEDGLPTSFQPIHVYSNNIWDAPALTRLVAQSSSAVWMNNVFRPHRFKHFSSRSDSFATVVAIGYWTVNAIPEDSRQYYDSFFRFRGRLAIEPIYVPLRMDAVLAAGYWKTIINQYRQLRRWAWGIVDLAYVVERSRHDHAISWWRKTGEIFRLLESHYTWATSAIFITVVAWLPLVLNPNFHNTVFGANLPEVTRWCLNLALVGMFATVVVSILLLPPRPEGRRPAAYLGFVAQWLLSPVASIFLSGLAAIDAQTRLMFGRYMEYQVTDKTVGKSGGVVSLH